MLTETFEEVLYCSDLDTISKLPSPEKLKHRVIISTKPPKEYLDDKTKNIHNEPSHKKDSGDGSWDDEPVYDTDQEDNDKVYVTGLLAVLTLNITSKNQIISTLLMTYLIFYHRALTSTSSAWVLQILMSLTKRSVHHLNTSILSPYMLGNQKEV